MNLGNGLRGIWGYERDGLKAAVEVIKGNEQGELDPAIRMRAAH